MSLRLIVMFGDGHAPPPAFLLLLSSAALEKGFVCPITNTIMFYPVVAADGKIYERHAIQVWIATAVDNEKQPLSPATNNPLDNLILKPDNEMRKKIEFFIKKNKLQNHPDRVKPPSATTIEEQQADISAQASRWLTEATPGKGEAAPAFEDMANYATLSAKRRQEEVESGADIVLVVRTTRNLHDLLRRLDCVDNLDTFHEAIGNSYDLLASTSVNDLFYICKERNRIVHETSSGDELSDVRRYRLAVRSATREIQEQVDMQDMYKSEILNYGLDRFYEGKYEEASAVLLNYISQADAKLHSDQVGKARRFALLSTSRISELRNADELYKHLEFVEKANGKSAVRCPSEDALKLCFSAYGKLARAVEVKEDCYCLVMFRMGRLVNAEASIRYFSKVLEKDPDHSNAVFCLSRSYMELEDWELAKTKLKTLEQNVSGKLLEGVKRNLKVCLEKTDVRAKTGHLTEDELDQLMADFGLKEKKKKKKDKKKK